jgi:hypothetical protein
MLLKSALLTLSAMTVCLAGCASDFRAGGPRAGVEASTSIGPPAPVVVAPPPPPRPCQPLPALPPGQPN